MTGCSTRQVGGSTRIKGAMTTGRPALGGFVLLTTFGILWLWASTAWIADLVRVLVH